MSGMTNRNRIRYSYMYAKLEDVLNRQLIMVHYTVMRNLKRKGGGIGRD